jgi:hypothetical protein
MNQRNQISEGADLTGEQASYGVRKLTTRSTLAKRASPDLGVVRGGIAEIAAGGH